MPKLTGTIREYKGTKVREVEGGKWLVDHHHKGKRQQKTCETMRAAKAWIDERKADRDRYGILVTRLTPEEIMDAADAFKILREFDQTLSLAEVTTAYVERSRAREGSWTVTELYEKHMADMVAKERRKSTITDKRTRLASFVKLYGEERITDIRPAHVQGWLEATNAKGRNRQNYETAIQSLFNFAAKTAPNEFTNSVAKFPHQRKPEAAPAEIVSAKVARDVLHQLEAGGWIREATSLAICLFCGLRTSEVIGAPKDASGSGEGGLRWRDIDFDEGCIIVPAALSKTRDRREVKIPPNLMNWLVRYRKKSGRIGPGTTHYYRRFNAACKATGNEWPSNAARHSAGTYRAKLDGERTAAEMLGHTGSVRMFRDHYSAPTTKAEARAFFEIQPAQDQKAVRVVKMKEMSA